MTTERYFFVLITVMLSACDSKQRNDDGGQALPKQGTFAFDHEFMKAHQSTIVLSGNSGKSKVLLVGAYQARVMTSTSGGDAGKSYGWINYELIKSGQVQAHMNPLGGEDRFWMGPEGGQFSIFFKKNDPFDFDHWQTPAPIDAEPFELISNDSNQASFKKLASISNYSGFTFNLEITRRIQLLDSSAASKELGIPITTDFVAYQTESAIRNTGKNWKKETGLLSVWILGMLNPSLKTTIILPHGTASETSKVTTDYFGKIPNDRLREKPNVLLMKGDGRFRGKVGIAPGIANELVGCYNADDHILTVVKIQLDRNADYVNSKWEKQQFPYQGDAINAYNDGPLENGKQLGPFFELESSSPARELKSGESVLHKSITFHFEGDESQLNEIAKSLLGVNLEDLKF